MEKNVVSESLTSGPLPDSGIDCRVQRVASAQRCHYTSNDRPALQFKFRRVAQAIVSETGDHQIYVFVKVLKMLVLFKVGLCPLLTLSLPTCFHVFLFSPYLLSPSFNDECFKVCFHCQSRQLVTSGRIDTPLQQLVSMAWAEYFTHTHILIQFTPVLLNVQ